MVFFVLLLDALAKKLGFLIPKIIHKAAKESSLNIYLWQWLFCHRRHFTLRGYFAVSYLCWSILMTHRTCKLLVVLDWSILTVCFLIATSVLRGWILPYMNLWGLLCSSFKPGFCVNSVFDLSCLISPYLFSAFWLISLFVQIS